MKTLSDRILVGLAYFYISIPFFIFVLGWIKWHYAVPISIIVLVSIILSLRENHNYIEIDFNKHKFKIVFSLSLIAVWVLLSGIGGFGFQSEDFHYRNAIFRDLINHPWPVIYSVQDLPSENPLQGKTTMLVYYMGFWLPSAIVGKIFGWQVANFFLFVWAFLGITLVFYFLSRYVKTTNYKVILSFVFFGGLSIFGQYIFDHDLKIYYPLWGGNYIYSSNTWNLYYVHNQIITPWLFITLIFNNFPKRNIFLLYALCFLQGPFSFLGTFPYLAWYVLKEFNFKNLIPEIKKFITFQNTLGAVVVLGLVYVYYSTNQSANRMQLVSFDAGKYFVFIIVEFGILSVLLFNRYKTNILFYIVIFMLLIIPFFQIGFGKDFVERVSIPSLFILMMLTIQFLIYEKPSIRKNLIYACLVIGAIVPAEKILKSAYITTYHYISENETADRLAMKLPVYPRLKAKFEDKEVFLSDSLVTVNTHKNKFIMNFMGVVDEAKFYKILAKKKDE